MKALKPLIILLLFAVTAFAQNEKGVVPVSSPVEGSREGVARAVVIGISDYQSPEIPDLHYAHRDAEAFARFLLSPAGGSMDQGNLQLLLNKDATNGRIVAAFDWLMAESKEGDRAIIYFSGHSDVERNTQFQLGFLLSWDAPARNYMAGAFPLYYLQAVVSTLTQETKAHALLITDACHAGKLAGTANQGTETTTTNMIRQFSGSPGILACQPGELALEGPQWGGGRGLFSYHLIDGLSGLADTDHDKKITLLEIGRYLEDRVATEAAPQSQTPLVLGNKSEILFHVDSVMLTGLQEDHSATTLAMLYPVEDRGMEDALLATADAETRAVYLRFKNCIAGQRLLPRTETDTACAEYCYGQLIRNEQVQSLHGLFTRNYAAALLDEVQQVLNGLLDMDLGELALSRKVKIEKYRPYPLYLARAAELLGEHHYLYRSLQARRLFFEGYLASLSNRNPNPEHGNQTLALFRQALEWEGRLPHVYWMMSKVFAYNLSEPDSAAYYAREAVALAPTWILPYTDLAQALSQRFGQHARAAEVLQEAGRIDPASAVVWKKLGAVYLEQKQYKEAEKLFLKIVDNTPDSVHIPMIFNNLGALYLETGRYRKAESYLTKTIAWDSTQRNPWYTLGCLYERSGKNAEAERAFQQVLALDPMFTDAFTRLGMLSLRSGQLPLAKTRFEQAIRISAADPGALFGLALLYSRENNPEQALHYLELALQNGLLIPGDWESNPDFKALRQIPAAADLLRE